MITWEQYCKDFAETVIRDNSGLRQAARYYKIDPAVLSKIKNGKYIPSRKTLAKMFPDHCIPEVITIIKE